MNKKTMIIGIVVAIVAVIAIVAISVGVKKANDNKPEKKIIGTWQGETNDGMDTAFVFNEDKTVEYYNEFGFDSKGTYEFKEDTKISIKLESWDKEKVYILKFKDKDRLSLEATDEYSPSYKEMKKVDNYKFEKSEE